MEKITKALIEEINDVTSYSDLIKLQKLIDVVINKDFRNSEKIRGAAAETKNKINTTELEKLQTLPIGYTSILNYDEAYDCIGDGSTVDIIAHILKYAVW